MCPLHRRQIRWPWMTMNRHKVSFSHENLPSKRPGHSSLAAGVSACTAPASFVAGVVYILSTPFSQLLRQKSSLGGYSPWDKWLSAPVGSSEAPTGSLVDEVPRSWSSLETLFTDFDFRDDQNSKNLKISAHFTSWILTCLFHGGAKRHFGA